MEQNEKIKVTQTHAGQSAAYRDTYNCWQLATDITDEQTILDYCQKNLKACCQTKAQWSMGKTPEDYFNGYYVLTRTDYGWQYSVTTPYPD